MSGRRIWSKGASVGVLGVVYAAALGAGLWVAEASLGLGVWQAALLGDLAATGFIFVAAVVLDNTSAYDPYWSVVPLPLALWWHAHPGADGSADPVRFALVATLLGVWGVRLTANFLQGWRGLAHEDWRYAQQRRLGTVRYWLVSLGGFQVMPTLVVFGAMLPVYALTREPGGGPGPIDAAAAALAVAAVALETTADEQKRRRVPTAGPGGLVASGVWAWCRHPNYLGEVGFWWAVFGFAVAAGVGNAWTVAGALGMTMLFRFVSVPLMDRRMRGRYPGYGAYADAVPALLPRLRAATPPSSSS